MSLKVLVVDDEPNQLRLLEFTFQNAGYEVVSAESGAAALKKVREVDPDLMVLDVMLPDVNGLEVCRRLRADEATANLPIVLLTALVDPGTRAKGLRMGADEFLTKPIEPEALTGRVRQVVESVAERVRDRPPKETRVLLVDDEPSLLRLVEFGLKNEGFSVTTATSGREAIEKTSEAPPDIIILDVRLPDVSGLEVCRQIRSMPETAEIPIVMLTALVEVSDRVNGLEAGADKYLPKPVDSDELVARVRSLVERTRAKRIRGDDGRDHKILVVEDEPSLSRLLSFSFEHEGFTVRTAPSAADALKQIEDESPDLLLLDVLLPDGSGLELCRTVRSRPETSDLPIIILSALNDVPDRISGLEAGADEYLTKPVDTEELAARVAALLDRDRQRTTL